ncbi:hypothetical protein Ami103574_02670 [Aminipila butyrica]|uniref:Uncharacterized protein n=1 Tax=Aminipila butyrica TaxID=433296 RepID=A0A858BR12_9FIRM|nr:hypothetical protein [Aminipila butyrica]QIB68283.1 hypothetical protein Ami103574_02670 [Aminipila butyrica]
MEKDETGFKIKTNTVDEQLREIINSSNSLWMIALKAYALGRSALNNT